MEKHISEILPAVIGKEGLQPIESTLSGSGVLVEAIKGQKIYQLPDQTDLEKCLRYCMLLVGMRANNLPGKEETAILFNHIHKFYSGHTVAEIRLAFEMAIAGELEIEPNDVKAYENFSTIYFSQIINSYRRWAAQEFKQNIKAIEPPPPQRIFTEAELEDGAREDVERQYQAFLRGQELKSTEFNRSILAKDKLLNENETTIEFFKRKAEAGFGNIYTRG